MEIKKNKQAIKDFIINKSKELGIDAVAFGNIKEITDLKIFEKAHEEFTIFNTFISVAFSYNYDWNDANLDSSGYIAHYTSANFYKILSNKMVNLAKAIKESFNIEIPNKKFYRIFVNSKLNDKLYAYASGLGEYTRNTLISVNHLGQKCILGELLLSIEIDSDYSINENFKFSSKCNNCMICVNKCPTKALSENGFDKTKCIQHLSTQLDWNVSINKDLLLKIWGSRFYGCTDCLDNCPINKTIIFNKDKKPFNLTGYIGINFDFMEILNLKKEDYKVRFKNNQLSNSWVKPLALLRNSIAGLYNLGKIDVIKKYLNNIDIYNWDESEKVYLKEFIISYLKLEI